jgi:Right handed beta helix region
VGSLGPFFKMFLILSALMLASASFTFVGLGIAKGVTRYADGQLSSNCTSRNYSIEKRDCTGRDGDAYRSLQTAVNASAAGDTVLVRAFSGTYTGSAELQAVGPITGAVNNRIFIEGYQSELPVVKGFNLITHVYIKNLIVDAANEAETIGFSGTINSRIENVEVGNQGYHGFLGVKNSELINLNVHHNGFNSAECKTNPGQCHGLYTAGDGDNNIIDGGRYHNNEGFGIHCYTDCRNTIIRNLRADHNRGAGIIVAFDSGVEVYNVVADNNGVGVWFAADGAIGYNITAYNNSSVDIYVSDFSNQTLENSIGLPNGISTISGTTTSNNISGGSASSYFVDADNANFQLISTSTANNVGADLSLLYY